MQTRTETISSLYQDGFLDVPSYQRSYSWEEPQLADLIDDLRYLPEETDHFLGNIILRKKDGQYQTDRGRRFDVYEIVDGQQRLTTALLLLYVATGLDDVVEETVSEDNLIFPVDERPRLMPQDQDGEFFRDSLLGNASLECETPSQERLEYARDFFESELEDLPVREISERLRYDCTINVVEIDGDSEAASIFESLNDRGKPLSSLDKTKSFLMYMDDRSSNRGALNTKIKQRFGSIYHELFVLSNGHDRVSDFNEDSIQRFHWGIYDGYDSDEYFNSVATLKDRLREQYRNGRYETVQCQIEEYTLNLREAASAFAALFTPSQRPSGVESGLKRLLALGRAANVLPVLMAAQMVYGDDDQNKMADIINACETLVFRVYASDGRRADTGRGKLVRLAHSIHTDDSYRFEDVLNRLESITRIYTDDDRFERNLRAPDFYESMSSRDIRYLFYHHGQNLDIEIREEVRHDLDQLLSTSFEVEHILAQNLPEEDIHESIREEFGNHVHRLGNLTVASEYWNKSYGNLPFEQKKIAPEGREAEYKSSNLRVQQSLAKYDEFGRDEIAEREQKIVDFALEEWGIASKSHSFGGGSTHEGPDDVEYESLPGNFFRRLTPLQEAFIRVLLKNGGWILNEDVHQQMADDFELATGGINATAGILAGLTRKYSRDFTYHLISYNRIGEQVQYRINPELGYLDALRERLEAPAEEK
jgi:hypothetical protein